MLVAHLSERIEALTTGSDELIVRVELAGETPLAQTLRSPRELESFEHELQRKTGALGEPASEIAVIGVVDAAEGRMQGHYGLRLQLPDELIEASCLGLEYLRGLLADLPEELIERSLSTDDA